MAAFITQQRQSRGPLRQPRLAPVTVSEYGCQDEIWW